MKKTIMKAAAVCGAVGLLAAGGTIAYLTDYDNEVNEFTVGTVDIDLEEKNWNPEDTVKTEPSQVISKDPKITNTGVNDAFVYLEVSIPTADVVTADAAGNRQPGKNCELFTFEARSDWKLLEERTVGTDKVYTYAYSKILQSGQTTSTLFDTVTFANVVEGQLSTRKFNIPVRAYAIQTENTGGGTGSVLEQATQAYQKYVNQNTGQEGRVTR